MSDVHGHYQIQSSLVISNVNGHLNRGLSYVELTLTNCFQLHVNLSYMLIFRMLRCLLFPCLVMVCNANMYLFECVCFLFPDVSKFIMFF